MATVALSDRPSAFSDLGSSSAAALGPPPSGPCRLLARVFVLDAPTIAAVLTLVAGNTALALVVKEQAEAHTQCPAARHGRQCSAVPTDAVAPCASQVTKLGIVLDLNGSVAGTAITFIVPGLIYYLLHKGARRTPLGLAALAMAVIGTALVPVSLTAAFLPSGVVNASAAR